MSAIVEAVSFGQDALPVCLWQENPYRLVSLICMLQIEAGNLARACNIFGQMCMTIREGKRPGGQTFGIVVAELEGLERDCQSPYLSTTLAQARRAKQLLSWFLAGTHGVTLTQIDVCFSDVSSRLADELGARFVFTLPPEAAAQYAQPLKDWEAIVKRWPKITLDIEESAKCFALERYAAAIFHILLVAEFGVIEVCDLLGVSGDRPGWGCVDRLQKLLNKKYPDRTSPEQKHSVLLTAIVPMIVAVKDSWRHKISHVDNKLVWLDADFSQQIASEVIGSTRGFMRRLAEELPVKVGNQQ